MVIYHNDERYGVEDSEVIDKLVELMLEDYTRADLLEIAKDYALEDFDEGNLNEEIAREILEKDFDGFYDIFSCEVGRYFEREFRS